MPTGEGWLYLAVLLDGRPPGGGTNAGERRLFCPDRSVTRAERASFIIHVGP